MSISRVQQKLGVVALPHTLIFILLLLSVLVLLLVLVLVFVERKHNSMHIPVVLMLLSLSYFMWQVALRAVLQSYQQSYLNLGIIFKLSFQDHHCNSWRTACKEVWPMFVQGINTFTCEIIFKNSVKHPGRAQGCPLRSSSRGAQIERNPVGS